MSTELMEKVDEILKNAKLPDRHSYFQIEKFIIGKEPTAQAQHWAIVRELDARRDTVEALRKDLSDAEDNLELFDIRIERLDKEIGQLKTQNSPEASLNIREREINIRKLQRDKEALAVASRKVIKKLKAVLEEMAYLASGHEKIKDLYGPMRPLDDEAAQKEMWNEKLLEEFNLRVILQRPLDPEFIRTVMCLHDEAPVKRHVVALVNNIQAKMISAKTEENKTGK